MSTDVPAGPGDPHARCLEAAAARLGVPAVHERRSRPGDAAPARRWLRLEVGGRSYLYRAGVLRHDGAGDTIGPNVNGYAPVITGHRAHTKEFLAAAGVVVPAGALFAPADTLKARAFFTALDRPACVKANARRTGADTVAGLTDAAAFDAAFRAAAARTAAILVEEQVEGVLVRFFHVAGAVVAERLKRPAMVEGDGATTLHDLIAAWNLRRVERALPGHPPLAIDAAMLAALAAQGLGLEDRPAAGRAVRLSAGTGRSSGAESVARAGTTHPSYAVVAGAACAAIPGLLFGSVDMVIRDPRQPAAPGNHWVLEIASAPAIADFHHPWEGEPQDVAGAILAWLTRERPAPEVEAVEDDGAAVAGFPAPVGR